MNNDKETSNLDDLKQVVIITLSKTHELEGLVCICRLDDNNLPTPIRWNGDRKLLCDARTDVQNLILPLMEMVTGQKWLQAEKNDKGILWHRVDYHHRIEQRQVREQA